MRRGRRSGKKHTQPSDHDPAVRANDIALATVIGVTFEYSTYRRRVYGRVPDPNRHFEGRIINSPIFQQRYQVARWFVEHLNLKEELPYASIPQRDRRTD